MSRAKCGFCGNAREIVCSNDAAMRVCPRRPLFLDDRRPTEVRKLQTCGFCRVVTSSPVCQSEEARDRCPVWGERVVGLSGDTPWLEKARTEGVTFEDRQRAASSDQRSSFAPDGVEPTSYAVPDGWMHLHPVGMTDDNGLMGYRRPSDGEVIGLNHSHVTGLRRGKIIGIDGWQYKLWGRDGILALLGRPLPPKPAPFTPEQEKRLRQIAWEAGQASTLFDNLSRMGQPIEACRVRDAFLRGDE